MNYYHIWANLNKGSDPIKFAENLKLFLDQLVKENKMCSYRITRMKLGFRSIDLPEFHIVMDFKSMQELDDAMTLILENKNNIENHHVAFNQMIDQDSMHHALYRDYPDVT
jgi:hypothetical protein